LRGSREPNTVALRMGAFASSFEVRTDSPGAVMGGLLNALSAVTKPAFALVFCSGKLAGRLGEMGTLLRSKSNIPIVLASGPGVLSERRELEGESAATGVVCGGKIPSVTLCSDNETLTREKLEALLAGANTPAPSLLFIRSEGFNPKVLWQLRAGIQNPLLFGAGTHGSPGLVCVQGQEVTHASALNVRFSGLGAPTIHTTHSCKLLAPPMAVTKAHGSMVEELDGQPALSVLERLGAGLRGQPLVFTVLSPPQSSGAPELLVRGIQGVDPGKRSLLISEEATLGMMMTFAVRDAAAAREDMTRVCRQAMRDLAGAAPRFAIYFNCSGRGRALHSAPNVDTRILKEFFAGTPIAGFQSAFEIGPFNGAPALQLYTGMLAVFAASS
jgi:small ligand-binding sensory domain FIST